MFTVAMIATNGYPVLSRYTFNTLEAAQSHAAILNRKAWQRRQHELKARAVPIPTVLSQRPG